MKTASWAELVGRAGRHTVEPVRRLRDESGRAVLQYWDGNKERIAVRDRDPYGTSYGLLGAHLLRLVEQTPDYSIFEVSEDTLSLRAITLGTGSNHASLLLETYRQVGETLGRAARIVPVPLLGVVDFAVVRPTGDVLFVPPVHFGEGTQDRIEHARALVTSMQEAFGDLWPERDALELTEVAWRGVQDGGS